MSLRDKSVRHRLLCLPCDAVSKAASRIGLRCASYLKLPIMLTLMVVVTGLVTTTYTPTAEAKAVKNRLSTCSVTPTRKFYDAIRKDLAKYERHFKAGERALSHGAAGFLEFHILTARPKAGAKKEKVFASVKALHDTLSTLSLCTRKLKDLNYQLRSQLRSTYNAYMSLYKRYLNSASKVMSDQLESSLFSSRRIANSTTNINTNARFKARLAWTKSVNWKNPNLNRRVFSHNSAKKNDKALALAMNVGHYFHGSKSIWQSNRPLLQAGNDFARLTQYDDFVEKRLAYLDDADAQYKSDFAKLVDHRLVVKDKNRRKAYKKRKKSKRIKDHLKLTALSQTAKVRSWRSYKAAQVAMGFTQIIKTMQYTRGEIERNKSRATEHAERNVSAALNKLVNMRRLYLTLERFADKRSAAELSVVDIAKRLSGSSAGTSSELSPPRLNPPAAAAPLMARSGGNSVVNCRKLDYPVYIYNNIDTFSADPRKAVHRFTVHQADLPDGRTSFANLLLQLRLYTLNVRPGLASSGSRINSAARRGFGCNMGKFFYAATKYFHDYFQVISENFSTHSRLLNTGGVNEDGLKNILDVSTLEQYDLLERVAGTPQGVGVFNAAHLVQPGSHRPANCFGTYGGLLSTCNAQFGPKMMMAIPFALLASKDAATRKTIALEYLGSLFDRSDDQIYNERYENLYNFREEFTRYYLRYIDQAFDGEGYQYLAEDLRVNHYMLDFMLMMEIFQSIISYDTSYVPREMKAEIDSIYSDLYAKTRDVGLSLRNYSIAEGYNQRLSDAKRYYEPSESFDITKDSSKFSFFYYTNRWLDPAIDAMETVKRVRSTNPDDQGRVTNRQPYYSLVVGGPDPTTCRSIRSIGSCVTAPRSNTAARHGVAGAKLYNAFENDTMAYLNSYQSHLERMVVNSERFADLEWDSLNGTSSVAQNATKMIEIMGKQQRATEEMFAALRQATVAAAVASDEIRKRYYDWNDFDGGSISRGLRDRRGSNDERYDRLLEHSENLFKVAEAGRLVSTEFYTGGSSKAVLDQVNSNIATGLANYRDYLKNSRNNLIDIIEYERQQTVLKKVMLALTAISLFTSGADLFTNDLYALRQGIKGMREKGLNRADAIKILPAANAAATGLNAALLGANSAWLSKPLMLLNWEKAKFNRNRMLPYSRYADVARAFRNEINRLPQAALIKQVAREEYEIRKLLLNTNPRRFGPMVADTALYMPEGDGWLSYFDFKIEVGAGLRTASYPGFTYKIEKEDLDDLLKNRAFRPNLANYRGHKFSPIGSQTSVDFSKVPVFDPCFQRGQAVWHPFGSVGRDIHMAFYIYDLHQGSDADITRLMTKMRNATVKVESAILHRLRYQDYCKEKSPWIDISGLPNYATGVNRDDYFAASWRVDGIGNSRSSNQPLLGLKQNTRMALQLAYAYNLRALDLPPPPFSSVAAHSKISPALPGYAQESSEAAPPRLYTMWVKKGEAWDRTYEISKGPGRGMTSLRDIYYRGRDHNGDRREHMYDKMDQFARINGTSNFDLIKKYMEVGRVDPAKFIHSELYAIPW